ncbi:hypothetical protein NDU88_007708 [Pleurodeles waltl]|uniref:Uncharacterized protein n=1 Tax=Pleurodeles waltl TaxID=8319 RepID=A0AAV7PPS2_PLEWA|nr:hypothetical protein NDU88_007708 [Pleurodeles waltl]
MTPTWPRVRLGDLSQAYMRVRSRVVLERDSPVGEWQHVLRISVTWQQGQRPALKLFRSPSETGVRLQRGCSEVLMWQAEGCSKAKLKSWFNEQGAAMKPG